MHPYWSRSSAFKFTALGSNKTFRGLIITEPRLPLLSRKLGEGQGGAQENKERVRLREAGEKKTRSGIPNARRGVINN